MITAELIQEHLEWTSKTFPKGTAHGAALHAEREIHEVQEDIIRSAPKEQLIEEYADVLGCIIDSINRSGITPEEVNEVFNRKLQKNKARKWKDNGDGSYSHIKE